MFLSPWKCSFKISKVAKYNWNKTPDNMNRRLDTVYFPIVTWPYTDQVFETHALWTHFLIFCFLILKWKIMIRASGYKVNWVQSDFYILYRGLSQDPERNVMLLGINFSFYMRSLNMGRNKNNSFLNPRENMETKIISEGRGKRKIIA